MHPTGIAICVASLCALAHPAARAADARRDATPAAALAALTAAEWDYQMEHNPVWASTLGDRRFNARWDDLSIAALDADDAHNRAVLSRLDEIDRERLMPAQQLDYDLLRRTSRQWVAGFEFGWRYLPVSQMTGLPEGLKEPPGVQFAYRLADVLRFATMRDYEDWIERLHTFPVYVEQTIALMRAGTRLGFIHPRAVVTRVMAAVAPQAASTLEASGFYSPFLEFPPGIADPDRARLAAAAQAAIADEVLPALRKFERYLATEYLPAAPERVGIWQMPHGDAMYAWFARVHTTTDLTPERIHAIGLAEVARIRGEMEGVKRESGFAGSLEEFFEFMRTDPRFFRDDAAQLLVAYRALAKTVDPLLQSIIGRLPRAQYGVNPMSATIAPGAPGAFYYPGAADGTRPGEFQVNLYRPETRPSWQRVALTLHEAVPGHHLQTSLAAELEDLSPFRRHAYDTAYGEGWALYCEWLGNELGLYGDPYDRFGQLAMELWRAIRLVVDTGMHAKRWTRAQAIDYFVANSPFVANDVEVEIDRYVAWPGQALAYKIGQLEILRLRRKAEAALGPAFDVRRFHDTVLGAGSLPLDILARRVDAWIASEKSAPGS